VSRVPVGDAAFAIVQFLWTLLYSLSLCFSIWYYHVVSFKCILSWLLSIRYVSVNAINYGQTRLRHVMCLVHGTVKFCSLTHSLNHFGSPVHQKWTTDCFQPLLAFTIVCQRKERSVAKNEQRRTRNTTGG